MSDQGFGQGTPGDDARPPGGMAPPPPPPPAGLFPGQPAASPPPPQAPPYQAPRPQPQYAPPAQPPQAYGAPQPGQPPKKRRIGLVIGIIVAVLALCGLASCAVLLPLLSSAGSNRAAVVQAEEHFSGAMSAVATASASIKKANASNPASAITAANKSLRVGRDEIAAARASAERLSSSQGRTDYLAALTAATSALDGLQDLIAYLDTASGMAGKVSEAGKLGSTANSDLNAAISAGNSASYSTMRSKAQAATAGYAKATALFKDASKLDPSAGLDKAAAYTEKRRQQSDIVVQMAAQGAAHELSSYNLNIKRMNAISREAVAIGQPAIVKDPKWLDKRLASLDKAIVDAGTRTDELRAKALKELGITK